MLLPESVEGLPSQGRGDGRILKITLLLENMVERMPGYVFIPEADTLNMCRTKDVPCGELVGIIECITP